MHEMQPFAFTGAPLSGGIARLRARMSPEALARADRIAHINNCHVKNPMDRELESIVGDMLEFQAAFGSPIYDPEAHKIRAIFLIGNSGSGKSTAIRRAFAQRPELAPPQPGEEFDRPAVSFVAPKPCTVTLLAATALAAIGYEIERMRQENQMWALLREQIRERQLLWMHIDEMQHAIRSRGLAGVKDVIDIVKNVVQLPNWPLHVVFSGVASLAAVLEHDDGQLANRCHVLRFDALVRGTGTASMKRIIAGVIRDHAGMEAEDAVASSEMANRVIHAVMGAFGTAIQLTREAIFVALRDGRERVLRSDFATAYGRWSGCQLGQNVFVSDDWEKIKPNNAIADFLRRAKETEKAARSVHP